MLRILIIILLTIATLLTAAGWWMQISGRHGVMLNITPGSRIVFSGQYNTVSLLLRWGPYIQILTEYPVTSTSGIPGVSIYLVKESARGPNGTRAFGLGIQFHIWLATGLLAVGWIALPFASRQLKRRRRRKRGLCVKCGNDLTGNESGTCPDCATKTED